MEHETHSVLTTHSKAWSNKSLLFNWFKNTTVEKFRISRILFLKKLIVLLSKLFKLNNIKQRIFLLNFFKLIKNIEHQFRILEWFLKDHVTLKTGLMTAKNSALPSQ